MTTTLQAMIRGRVLQPGDDDYDSSRSVWNAMVDRRPRYIVQCSETADVVAAVRFATDHGLELGIRCGGHGIVGHAVPDDGLMIDLRPMGEVSVDPLARRARVQGGALLGALDDAAQAHGLATTAGNVSHTGVGGLTLGGGMGWLARQHGLACDNVVSFELVTAAGETLRVSAESHPDLYWALRGGGGNFGVVTEFEFALHPEPGLALTAEFRYPVTGARDAMRRWRDLNHDAPRQATYSATIADGTVALGLVWVGDPSDGNALISALADELAGVARARVAPHRALVVPRPAASRGRPRGARVAQVLEGALLQRTRRRGHRRRARARWRRPAEREPAGVRRCDRRGRRRTDGVLRARHRVRVRRRSAMAGPRRRRSTHHGGATLRRHHGSVRERRLRERPRRRGHGGCSPRLLGRPSSSAWPP